MDDMLAYTLDEPYATAANKGYRVRRRAEDVESARRRTKDVEFKGRQAKDIEFGGRRKMSSPQSGGRKMSSSKGGRLRISSSEAGGGCRVRKQAEDIEFRRRRADVGRRTKDIESESRRKISSPQGGGGKMSRLKGGQLRMSSPQGDKLRISNPEAGGRCRVHKSGGRKISRLEGGGQRMFSPEGGGRRAEDVGSTRRRVKDIGSAGRQAKDVAFNKRRIEDIAFKGRRTKDIAFGRRRQRMSVRRRTEDIESAERQAEDIECEGRRAKDIASAKQQSRNIITKEKKFNVQTLERCPVIYDARYTILTIIITTITTTTITITIITTIPPPPLPLQSIFKDSISRRYQSITMQPRYIASLKQSIIILTTITTIPPPQSTSPETANCQMQRKDRLAHRTKRPVAAIMLPSQIYIFLLFCSISLFTRTVSSQQATHHYANTPFPRPPANYHLPPVSIHTFALDFETLVSTYLDTFNTTLQQCRAAPYIFHDGGTIFAHLLPFYNSFSPPFLELLTSAFRSINSNISSIAYNASTIQTAHLSALASLVDMLTEAENSLSQLADATDARSPASYQWFTKAFKPVPSPTGIFLRLAARLPASIDLAIRGISPQTLAHFATIEDLLSEIGLRQHFSPRALPRKPDVDKQVQVDFHLFPLSRVSRLNATAAEQLAAMNEEEKRAVLHELRQSVKWERFNDGKPITSPPPALSPPSLPALVAALFRFFNPFAWLPSTSTASDPHTAEPPSRPQPTRTPYMISALNKSFARLTVVLMQGVALRTAKSDLQDLRHAAVMLTHTFSQCRSPPSSSNPDIGSGDGEKSGGSGGKQQQQQTKDLEAALAKELLALQVGILGRLRGRAEGMKGEMERKGYEDGNGNKDEEKKVVAQIRD
ncbi:kinetoplast DNA-associated protein [Drepanopeziza brunnea f. sp. 'multigermtubi' MB_m1]|uniref:Kinetoplast DNA-associated protein n=1 Tax=Marssonina brunnea f. sp. multigermtubi (strain MB_m1) TaxID=1072389 RepID=K1WH81_MARBU|nr:kinetoplast DNA-associated protein [Drepanopeziza brunnea f. sp. 'multigermtubi' MB_m1]EKD12136.1 kinetoplast DNA-associated protein [Drepanopeziza brunnea f. sp. 'multigermtubi' MB_m1]